MKSKELKYFSIGGLTGGSQSWFFDPTMKFGGCGAITACDCCIYFDLYKGTKLCPYDAGRLAKGDYRRFGAVMKPYIAPRKSGVDTTQIYVDGFGRYMEDMGCRGIEMKQLSGETDAEAAGKAIIESIDADLPAVCLILSHADPEFKDYKWHWFMLTGYRFAEERGAGSLEVKAVTYGEARWLDFGRLWDTGFERKGGLVLFEMRLTAEGASDKIEWEHK